MHSVPGRVNLLFFFFLVGTNLYGLQPYQEHMCFRGWDYCLGPSRLRFLYVFIYLHIYIFIYIYVEACALRDERGDANIGMR